MANASATKRAYVRGIADTLQSVGVTTFHDQQTLKHACEKVAAAIPGLEPVVSGDDGELYYRGATAEQALKVAQALTQISTNLARRGYKSAAVKTAARLTTEREAVGDILWAVKRAMDEGAAVGGTEGGENALSESVSAEMGEELDLRPEAYADSGTGRTVMDEPGAQIGLTQDHPGQDSDVVEGHPSNELIDTSKTSALRRAVLALKRAADEGAAMGATVGGENQMTASVSAEIIDELNRRPLSYADSGIGKTVFSNPSAMIGVTMDHPLADSSPVQGHPSNELIDTSKTSAVRFIEKMVPALPRQLSPGQKIAAARELYALPASLRQAYVVDLFSRFGG